MFFWLHMLLLLLLLLLFVNSDKATHLPRCRCVLHIGREMRVQLRRKHERPPCAGCWGKSRRQQRSL
jgi:hypothetical protein